MNRELLMFGPVIFHFYFLDVSTSILLQIEYIR